MKAQILKISGCKTQKEFYSKYPTEEAFMKMHKKEFKKAQLGESIKAQGGYNISNQWKATNHINPGTVNSYDLSNQWSNTLPQAQNGTGIDMGGSMPYIQAGTDLIQGLSMLKGERNQVNQANQNEQVSQVQLDAARTRDIDFNRMNKQLQIRPEDMVIQPNQLNNPYGIGTNILQGRNGLRIGGEIQNTYAPNTLYDDLGYEPLSDSDKIKNYQDGGDLSQWGMDTQFGQDVTSIPGQNLLNNFSNRIVNDGQGPNAGSKIGGGIGMGIGTALGGPLGGIAGKFIGEIGGGLIDQSGRKIKNYNRQTDQNRFMANQAQMNRSNSYMKEGGWMFPQDQFAMGGELQVYKGEAEPISQNKYLPEGGETVMFKGPSHANGGMPIQFGKEGVEVEGGEPAVKLQDSSEGDSPLVVFGNLPIHNSMLPLLGDPDAKGKKFKTYVADLSKKEDKMNKILAMSTQKVNDQQSSTSVGKLGLASYQANIMGANLQLQDLAEKKKRAGLLQQAINDMADEHGLVADNLAKGEIKKAKNGKKLIAQNGDKLQKLAANQAQQTGQESFRYNGTQYLTSQFADPLYTDPQGNKSNLLEGVDIHGQRSQGGLSASTLMRANDPKYLQSATQGLTPIDFNNPTPPSLWDATVPDTQNASDIPSKFPWMTAINSVIPYARPNYQLDRPDLSPEMMAMGFNNQEPVQARTVQPQLSTPYDVSFQDMLNKNQGDFRSMERLTQYNPAMLSQLGAQKYGANQQVLGEQFRQNQAEKDKVYGENRNTLNQSQLTNLGILNQQAEKQDMAKTKTKAEAINIAQSIADKMAKYKEEQTISNLEQNKYNYRFDSNGRPINMNQLAQWNMAGNTNPSRSSINGIPDEWMTMIDAKTGEFAGTRKKTAEELKSGKKNGGKLTARNGSIVRALKTIK